MSFPLLSPKHILEEIVLIPSRGLKKTCCRTLHSSNEANPEGTGLWNPPRSVRGRV